MDSCWRVLHFFDQIVQDALMENVGQIVFLGAGYDSRPYRFGRLIQETLLFEVDTGPTQIVKRIVCEPRRFQYRANKICVSQLRYGGSGGGLIKAGFTRGKSTLFVWEGVTYYLSADVVNSMAPFVRSNTPREVRFVSTMQPYPLKP